MAESIGADIGTRILQAVEGLGLRMDRLEARMDVLESRMDGMEARMGKLEARMGKLEDRVSGLEVQVTDLKNRMEKQERLMEMLGAEFIKSRDGLRDDTTQVREELKQLRTDMNEGFRRLSARIDLTDGVVVLLAKELRRPRELSEQLEANLRHIEAS